MGRELESEGDGPLVECELPLGRPGLVVHNELVLSGWAASRKGIAGVAVQIGERQWNAAYGLESPAAAKRLLGVEGADRAGYRLEIETSSWEPGPQVVTVAAFDRDGGRSALEGSVDIRPFPTPSEQPTWDQAALERDDVTLSLDAPAIEAGAANVEGGLEVRGWAYAREGIEAIVVTLDGAIQYEALRPLARPDLLREHGPGVAGDAGFALRVDPVDCPPGRHSLTVAALSGDGRTAGVECTLICHAAPAADSVADVELATAAPPPRLRADGERLWESRALLAESDAALCRAQARLALTSEERARRQLRDIEARARAADARFADRATELERELEQQTLRADAAAAHLTALEGSVSWRVTRFLRVAKRVLASYTR